MDIVDATTRSRMMAGIRSKNTGPELTVRRYLHGRGFRYRLHTPGLPGSPDIALAKHRVAIFVHGCFWHRHALCRYATTPASNSERWEKKFAANIERDLRANMALQARGWRIIIVWECELKRNASERLQRLVEEITYTAGL
jgi:DNA mismatch endonuclease (patch repair protein)